MMSEENKEVPVSFYVLTMFSVLFLVFFFIGQEPSGNKSEFTGALTVAGQDLSSPAGLIILGTVSILLIGFIVMFIVKMKHKKSAIATPVVPKADKDIQLPGSKLETKPFAENKLTENEVETLFKVQDTGFPVKSGTPNPIEKSQPATFEKYQAPSAPAELEKAMVNLTQLKYIITGMLKERKSGQEINDFLISHGYTAQQIEKATDEINVDSLKEYIKKCLSQGVNKAQIFESLKAKNWRIDLINKAFLSLN